MARDASPDLDPIDERGLGRIGDLERRPAGLEDHHAPVIRGVRRTLGQAEHIAVEGDRRLEVLGGDDQPHLADRRVEVGHQAPRTG